MVNAEQFFIDTFGIPQEPNSEIEFRLSIARRKRDALHKFIHKLAEAMELERDAMQWTKPAGVNIISVQTIDTKTVTQISSKCDLFSYIYKRRRNLSYELLLKKQKKKE